MKKTWGYRLALILIFQILILLCIPAGYLYGSNIDWLNQHTAIGETIRTACLEQKTLLPGFLNLGGGSNGFQFAYYGYLRPDILIGCLLPDISMEKIIMVYMLINCLSSALLAFEWLRTEGMEDSWAFGGSFLFMTAACFFHGHRQIMFINYMPFLILALLAVKKEKDQLLCICLVLIYLHSFYFSISCLAVLLWYGRQTRGRNFWKAYAKQVILSIGIAAILLLPTGLVILEHKRAAGTVTQSLMWRINCKLDSMLYTPYGMGLTAVSLYALCLGLGSKKHRKNCLLYLILSSWWLAAYLLNGTLYARGKILIPFMPLEVLESARILRELKKGEMQWELWPFLFLILSWRRHEGTWKSEWMAADILVILAIVLWEKCKRKKRSGCMANVPMAILLCMPFAFCLRTAQTENFVSRAQVERLEKGAWEVKTAMIPEPDPMYRFDSLRNSLDTGNRDAAAGRRKTTMYSSITNQDYSHVYYDLLQTPIQISNRVALLTADNPFLLHFMGIRYLETRKDQVPEGYRVMAEEGETVIAENPFVLPMAYVTERSMSEGDFQKLDSIEKLEALTRYTIVPDAWKEDDGESVWESKMESFEPIWKDWEIPEGIGIQKIEAENQETPVFQISAQKAGTLTAKLGNFPKGMILLLRFTVKNQTGKEVVIEINSISNKLSGRSAAYPNGNKTFHYQFSQEQGEFQISYSKGEYRVKDITWHAFPKESFREKEITKVIARTCRRNEILSCKAEVEKDGYFITSIPLQNGMEIWIDGKKAETEKVNEAFAGTRITAGTHEISIVFIPPGLRLGGLISIVSLLAFIGPTVKHRRR